MRKKITFPCSSSLLASSYKFSRLESINCDYRNLPKIAKAHLGTLCSLGVNASQTFSHLSKQGTKKTYSIQYKTEIF